MADNLTGATGGRPEGSIFMGMVWMAVLSLLLFWLPAFGPLIAGIVGGKVAGGVGNGLAAAVLPGLLLSILLALLFTVAAAPLGLFAPVVGTLAGATVFLVILIQLIPLMIGALIGGLMA